MKNECVPESGLSGTQAAPSHLTKLSLLCISGAILLVQPCRGQSEMWTRTGNLKGARWDHSATLLDDGRVLAAGGSTTTNGNNLTSAEVYDTATGTWSRTGSLSIAHAQHTATLLTNGKVLVTGGSPCFGSSSCVTTDTELYDPTSGSWSVTGSLRTARARHTGTLLADGKVLVTGGGSTNAVYLRNAELYNPATGRWAAAGNMSEPRIDHSAVLLPNGQVLVAGGFDFTTFTYLASAELYDPATRSFTLTGSMTEARASYTLTLLSDGRVLAAGGRGADSTIASAELYDPASGTWSSTGNLAHVRTEHTANLLPSGKVLVAGGINDKPFSQQTYINTAELYDPITGTWTDTGKLANRRTQHTATLLGTGQVLAAGGGNATVYLRSCEVYQP